ncbi:MAG: TetR/AcrR family transcriptional regulator [Cellvibrionaceae bacterium]|nr:TetR/AcrR family transcriptional regulator [Cellvibrionaceae bacterium]MCV6626903.1 TetR/AcrR family transcriptional regulator [Cellvibrionaceae bacterium]
MQTRKKNRKHEIVEYSLGLLQTQGYESFSYQDIASALGITKASIHYHFPKKEDLGIALCAAIQAWHQRLFEQVSNSDDTAIGKLERYVGGLLQYAQGPNKICPLSSLQADVACLPPALLPSLRALDQHELEFIGALLASGRERGELDFPGEPSAQAAIVVLSVKGALQYSRIHGDALLEPVLQQLRAQLLTATPE